MFAIKRKTFVLLLTLVMATSLLLTVFAFTDVASAEAQQPVAEPILLDGTTLLTGIGSGINVLTATRVNDFKTSYSILDRSALQQLNTSKAYVKEVTEYNFSSTNTSEFILNFELNKSFKISVPIVDSDVGLGVLAATLRSDANLNLYAYRYKYYKMYEYIRRQYSMSIDEAWNTDTYTGKYSQSFLDDLETLNYNNSDSAIKNFFERYGTHLIGSAYYGGRLTESYMMVTNTKEISTDILAALDASVNFPTISVGFEGTLKARLKNEFKLSDAESVLNVYALGGNAFSMSSSAQYQSSYNSWLNSLNDDTNGVIIDYPEKGLVPVWKMLPSEYSHLADRLENAFLSLSETIRSQFENEFKSGNYTEFSGGMGTPSDPYLIEYAHQMPNISKHLDKQFALISDIDMTGYTSSWTAIGSKYNPFTGTFDGREHKITNFAMGGEISEGSDYVYFGLFGYAKDATIANVEFRMPYISFTGSKNPKTDAKLFMGVAVGVAENSKLTNIFVNQGTCSYRCNRNGMSFVGGIVGFTKNTTVYDCRNSASIVSGRYSAGAGGIAGYSKSSIFRECISKGSVTSHGTSTGRSCAGGIVGIEYDKSGEETYYYYNTITATLSALNFSGKPYISSHTGTLWGQQVSKNFEP